MQDLVLPDSTEIDAAEQAAHELLRRVQLPALEADPVEVAKKRLQQELAFLMVGSMDRLRESLQIFEVLLPVYREKAKDPTSAYSLLPTLSEQRDVTFQSISALEKGASAFDGQNGELYRLALAANQKLLLAIESIIGDCEKSAARLNRAERRRLAKQKRPAAHMPRAPLSDPPPKPKR